MGDGPASQARHHDRRANVCPQEQHEDQPTLSDEGHNMAQGVSEQGPRREVTRRGLLGRQIRPSQLEVNREGNSFGNAPRRKRRKKTPSGGAPLTLANGALFLPGVNSSALTWNPAIWI